MEEIYVKCLTIAGIPRTRDFAGLDFVMNTPLEPPGSFATTPCGYHEPVPILRNQDGRCPLEVISKDDIDRVLPHNFKRYSRWNARKLRRGVHCG